jgi:histidinol phosphatase-like enzyme (inositol monophosphatase family)
MTGTPNASDLEPRYHFAQEVAVQAADFVRSHFQTGVAVERKGDTSPVTIADRGAEELLRQTISSAFPKDGIIGEELGVTQGESGYRWILDPIDGTKSFISDVPLFGTMVAVERDGQGLIGVISFPGLGATRIDAMVGGGAWETTSDGRRRQAKVSQTNRLKDGLVLTTDWEGFRERNAESHLNTVAAASWFMRTWGDCYGHYLVATGRAVAMIDARLKIWDAAALQPIVEEAGGTFTDWTGKSTINAPEGISTNGVVTDELLDLLS